MNREDVVRELIAKYRKRIEILQELIRELQADAGQGAVGAAPSGDFDAMDVVTSNGNLPIEVKEWQFMGKSQPEAAKALLAAAGRPLTTEQIIEGIKKGGVEVGGGKFTFYNILARADDVVRFRRNTWGLAEWPGAPKKRAPQPRKKRNPRRTVSRTVKSKQSATSEEKGL